MRRLVGLGIIVFFIVLGVLTGHKLSPESMAVIVGVIIGVVASVPTSILLIVLLRKSMQTSAPPPPQQPQYPPVFMISADGGQQRQRPQRPYEYEDEPPRTGRAITVVGEDVFNKP